MNEVLQRRSLPLVDSHIQRIHCSGDLLLRSTGLPAESHAACLCSKEARLLPAKRQEQDAVLNLQVTELCIQRCCAQADAA